MANKKSRIDNRRGRTNLYSPNNKEAMKISLNDENIVRKSRSELESMSHEKLVKHVIRMLVQLDLSRKRCVNLKIENNFLGRKLNLCQTKIEFYKNKPIVKSLKRKICNLWEFYQKNFNQFVDDIDSPYECDRLIALLEARRAQLSPDSEGYKPVPIKKNE